MRIGQPVSRLEDPVLLRGEGRYTDDLNEPGQAYAYIVRSPHAHGVLKSIGTEEAKKMPGVLAVYTGEDLKHYGAHKCQLDIPGLRKPLRRSLASGKVRFVGDPVACVVAETALQAKDAAEAVALDIEPLPAVALGSEAAKPDAAQIYDEAPGNVAVDFHYGDREKVADAFARAHHVTRVHLRNTRVAPAPMEPRAAICKYEDGRFTLTAPGQGVIRMKGQLAEILGVPEAQVRMRTYNVGGSFGMKGLIYPEYVCLAHAARELGRPVKWTDERSGSFLSDQHGRDSEITAELALDREGRFLALRLTGYGNVGAYLMPVGPNPPTLNAVKNSPSVYRTPLLEVHTKIMFTNTTPVGPYRGAGRPEANYYVERVIDAAADEMGIDRLELRLRNHVRPDEMPWKAPSGQVYDSGEFSSLLEKAVAAADVKGFGKRKAESKANGKLRGLGIGQYLEGTSPPGKELGLIRFDGDDTVTIATGTLDQGQGHWSSFAQVLAERLGVPLERVRLVQGDSDVVATGGGTGGSRSIMMSGAAIVQAAEKVVKLGKELAAEHLEAALQDIEFKDARFSVVGTDRGIGLQQLARKYPGKLDVSHVTEVITSSYPNGCHVCEVEVDPQTGAVEIARYASVNDFGVIVNPMLVEGQVHGGVVQGIGQVLMEEVRYDESGQLVTGSFMDYALPRAGDVHAPIGFASHPVPATTNPLGAKGCGEAGCAGALTSVMNAILDALKDVGVKHLDMPASPQRVWRAIQEANSATPTAPSG
jgi:carbon-monoxide dehydrogenase large subunit